MKDKVLDQLRGQLIVSCQALEEEPLYSDFIMMRMAKAVAQAGAKGIRANSIIDIKRIKAEVDLPMIGIIKSNYENSSVYISPSLVEIKALLDSPCEIIAMDATKRKRPKEDLASIVNYIHKSSDKLIMADCSCINDVTNAISLGFDIISSTLVSYTKETEKLSISQNDFALLQKMVELTHDAGKFFIAEGNIDSPKKAKRVLELGADSVVVGTAITRPREICAKYIKEIKEK